MSKYLKLFAQAIGIQKSIKRTQYEMATSKSPVAKEWRRQVDSTSKEPLAEEEAPTAESKTEPLDIHTQYHGNPDIHKGCCEFIECRTASKTSHDKDIYILTGRKGN